MSSRESFVTLGFVFLFLWNRQIIALKRHVVSLSCCRGLARQGAANNIMNPTVDLEVCLSYRRDNDQLFQGIPFIILLHNSIFSNRCTLYSISYTIICNNDMGMIQWQH